MKATIAYILMVYIFEYLLIFECVILEIYSKYDLLAI